MPVHFFLLYPCDHALDLIRRAVSAEIEDHVDVVLCDFGALTGVISDFEFPEETKRAYLDVEFICTKE